MFLSVWLVFSFLYFLLLQLFFFLSRFLPIRDFGQKTTVFSYFLKWFVFQMHFLLFASPLFLGFMWFDHVGWEISWSSLFWMFKSQIQLMVWVENDPHFSVAGTWGSVLLAQLLLMFLVFVCRSHFFIRKRKRLTALVAVECATAHMKDLQQFKRLLTL